MIDIESFVFDTVYNQMSVLHPEANISGGFDEKQTAYPNLVVRQISNIPYVFGNTDDSAENFSRVTFEVEATSDKVGTARSECKALLNDADGIMQSMKFRRTYMGSPLNINRTVYSQYARYEAIVGKPAEIDGKTVYQMYRR